MPIHEKHAYSAYGHTESITWSDTLSRFNGEYYFPVLGSYLLGNGHRCYSPSLMRFLSSDTYSPFDKGNINSYAYCSGEPINYVDPSGQFSVRQLLRVRSHRSFLHSAAARERHPIAMEKLEPASNPTHNIPTDFKLVGYHGSSTKYKDSLEAGIKRQPGANNTMGDGFYFSSRYDIASMFNGHDQGNGQVYGVYARNFKNLQKEIDFDYLGNSNELFVIRQHVFHRFVVRAQIEGKLIRRNSYAKNNT